MLRGDRIENSVYVVRPQSPRARARPSPAHPFAAPLQLSMRVDTFCAASCSLTLSEEVAKQFVSKIEDDYRVNMILDNLPVGMVRLREDAKLGAVKTYERGYPIGFLSADSPRRAFINNHLRFTILYHEDAEAATARIVGFEVEPFSVKHRRSSSRGAWDPSDPALRTCDHEAGLNALQPDGAHAEVVAGEEVFFTHDFVYRPSEIRWASRWDTYLSMTDTQIHWFSIINSLVIVLFLSGMVALIMMRTLHADIAAYNSPGGDAGGDAAEAAEESGWKLVHGDVLRPPGGYGTLAVLVGSGVQVLGMALITMFFALLGFLSPANRGALMTAMLLLFSFCGVGAGYVSSRLYRGVFRGQGWRLHTLRTALSFPGLCFLVFCVLNLLIAGQKSSGAVPFSTLFVLCFLWIGISVPLVFVGSYFGSKREPGADPVRTNKIPRQVPEQQWYMSGLVTCLVGGVLPFGAVFIELFFILTSMWMHQFYYVFGFLVIVLLILALTCAEISVVLVYFQLCAENYNWWWRSFLTSASSALYLFLYTIYYFSTKLEITKAVSASLYFGYMFLFSAAFFVVTGTIGFLASLAFVRSIYSSVKID